MRKARMAQAFVKKFWRPTQDRILISKILVGRKTSEVVEKADESSFGEGQEAPACNSRSEGELNHGGRLDTKWRSLRWPLRSNYNLAPQVHRPSVAGGGGVKLATGVA